MPVEKPEKKREQQEKRDDQGAKPPGQFVTDDLEAQTARFIEAVKGLARRRQEREADVEETWGPPPGSGGNHRSRRR